MKLQINKKMIFQFIRFAIVGVFNTVLDLLVLNFLVYIFNVNDSFIFSLCKGVSFSVAVINSYFMNKYFTFNKKDTNKKDFYIFVLISIFGLLINMVISGLAFYLLRSSFGSLPIHLITTISGMIGSLFGMFVNYIFYSLFVFK